MTTNDLTCRELVELVTDYLEGELLDDERMRFEDHLARCAGCRRFLDQMRLTIAAVGHLREDDLSPVVRDDLLSVFRTWKQTRGA
jgi:anti-sigma factor RsiW